MKEKVVAFISGALAAIIPNTASIAGMLGDFAVKVLTTAALGAVGGMAGLAGKELYNYLKSKPWQKRK